MTLLNSVKMKSVTILTLLSKDNITEFRLIILIKYKDDNLITDKQIDSSFV